MKNKESFPVYGWMINDERISDVRCSMTLARIASGCYHGSTDNGRKVFITSLESLADDLNLGVDQVFEHIDTLRRIGYLDWTFYYGDEDYPSIGFMTCADRKKVSKNADHK